MVVEFEYGVGKEGYCSYEHMVVQLEDVVDILKTIYTAYEFIFLFDHSCGHDCKREDGLNTNHLNKGFEGAKPKM